MYISILQMSSFYITFCGQTRNYFTRDGMSSVHSSYFWAADNPLAINERIKYSSASALGLES
jgi:hypothetical protein